MRKVVLESYFEKIETVTFLQAVLTKLLKNEEEKNIIPTSHSNLLIINNNNFFAM